MNISTNSLTHQYAKADKMMLYINFGLVAYSLILASWYSTWLEAIFVGGITAAALAFICFSSPGQLICRIAMASGFVVLTSLHIHQAKGAVEAHFGVFVLLAVLLYYRDWIPIVVYALLTAIHHISFFYLQSGGNNIFILPTADIPFMIILWHAFYVVIEAGLLIWFCVNLKGEANQSIEIMSLTQNIIADDNIDLTLRTSGSTTLLCQFDDFTGGVEELAKKVASASSELNNSGQTLAAVTGRIKSGTQNLLRESDQIAAAAEQMSAAISEVSQNAEEVANTVRDVGENAERAKDIGAKTQTAMEQLASQVDTAAKTIVELNEQTRDIGSVLDVIRGVAEQTNLLALNAAIEAARAGEQGRGFAVVADEVRTLAQRTQQSTEEIDQMIEKLQDRSSSAVNEIESSQGRVSDCVTSTIESQEIMAQVSGAIHQVNSMTDMIATASHQQSAVINEISRNLANIVDTTNGSVSDATSANESGELLLGLSKQLSEVVHKFKTN